jgi:hypothetical protein
MRRIVRDSLVSVQKQREFFDPWAPHGYLSPTPRQHIPVLTGLKRYHHLAPVRMTRPRKPSTSTRSPSLS